MGGIAMAMTLPATATREIIDVNIVQISDHSIDSAVPVVQK